MRTQSQKKIKRNLGQVTMEYILLAVVLITLFQIATKTLRDNDYLKNFQDTPNKIFVNLIKNGNWEVDETASRGLHPNQHLLHFTPDGEGP